MSSRGARDTAGRLSLHGATRGKGVGGAATDAPRREARAGLWRWTDATRVPPKTRNCALDVAAARQNAVTER